MATSIPPVNNVELDRGKLVDVLEFFGYRVGEHFSHPIRLVVHGGACMLLHPGLYNLAEQQAKLTPNMPIRKTTRDVDYIHRAFVAESMARGEPEAPGKLLTCIQETAIRFGLGADWMNSAADVALPMTTDPTGRHVDPIWAASIQKSNVDQHTIFSAANGMLRLVSVAPFWAVSLKLVRYAKWDPFDICLLLKYCTIIIKGTVWSRDYLESWLRTYCWSMGYVNYPPEKQIEMRNRIKHAICMVNVWFAATPTLEEFLPIGFRTDPHMRQPEVQPPPPTSREMVMGLHDLDSDQVEWGGGDRTGWKASFAGDWVKPHEKPVQPQLYHFGYPPPAQSHSLHPMLHQPIASSPLSTPPNQPATGIFQHSQPKTSFNVADWYAEDQRQRQRELQEDPTPEPKWKEKEGEVIMPFNPLLDSSDIHHPRRHNTEDPAWRNEHTWSHKLEPRRTFSHPMGGQSSFPNPMYRTAPASVSQPNTHMRSHIYEPETMSPHNPIAPPAVSRSSPPHNTLIPPPFILNPVYTSPAAIPPPPVMFQSQPMIINTKADRKRRGKARDRARDRARSAKSWHGLYVQEFGDAHQRASSPTDSEDDEDDDDDEVETPNSSPPQSESPKIYPLTTVVYYNQYQDQQEEKKRQKEQKKQHKQHHHHHGRHKSSPHSSSKPSPPQASPPHFSQIYHAMAPPPQQPPMWVLPASSRVPQAPQPQMTATTQFAGAVPMGAPIYSRPVIPPQEYTESNRSSGTLHKWMSALKI